MKRANVRVGEQQLSYPLTDSTHSGRGTRKRLTYSFMSWRWDVFLFISEDLAGRFAKPRHLGLGLHLRSVKKTQVGVLEPPAEFGISEVRPLS